MELIQERLREELLQDLCWYSSFQTALKKLWRALCLMVACSEMLPAAGFPLLCGAKIEV